MSKPQQERSVDRRRYHVIYKTTCLVTGRYYIGMHSTDDLADGYIGSGKRLWQSIKKHGAEQHVCEVLEHLPSREALREREAELVNKQLLEDKLCMNLTVGGYGDFGHVDNADPQYRHHRQAGARAMNAKLWSDPEFRRKNAERMSSMSKPWSGQEFKGKRHSEETLAVMRAKKVDHGVGSSNSQYGTKWMYHPLHGQCKVQADQLDSHLVEGWSLGRKITVV